VSDLLREIDEDIAKDKSEKFIEKWGLPIGIFLVILVAGLAAFFTWQSRSQNHAFEEAARFDQAVRDLADDPQTSVALLEELSTSSSGLGALSSFKIGDALLAAGDLEGALEAWQAYVQDATSNPHLVLTSRFKIAWFGNGLLEPDVIIEQISQLEQSETYAPYVPILNALRLIEDGDVSGAQSLLQGIVGDEEADPVAVATASTLLELANTL